VAAKHGLRKTCEFSGTLKECGKYLAEQNASWDGVWVLDDTLPVRLVPQGEFAASENALFLPGVSDAELRIAQGSREGFPVAVCQERACEALLETLAESGVRVLGLVPMSQFLTAFVPASPDKELEVFRREGGQFWDLWVFQRGALLQHNRVAKADAVQEEYLRGFLAGRFPGTELSPVVNFEPPQDPLLLLAQESDPPSLGQLQAEVPERRARQASMFRGAFKISVRALLALLTLYALLAGGLAVHRSLTSTDREAMERRRSVMQEISANARALEAQKNAVATVLQKRTRHAERIAAVAQELPKNLWLETWSIQGGKYRLVGHALASEDISQLLAALEGSPYFHHVRLHGTEHTTKRGRGAVRFEMTLEEKTL
jgi:Tfp pilus assembly protein PilN